MKDLQYFDQINDIMRRSGQLVMQYFQTDFEIFEKQGGYSLYTQVDIENELFLKQELIKLFPEASFLAEESGVSGGKSDWVWVIDALDGTRNFIKGIPHFCIMVALTYKNDPIISVIYQPITKELYYAEKGKGLWFQGTQQIKFVDRLYKTKSGIVICDQSDWLQYKLKLRQHHMQASRRYYGCAGIDALYLVQGNIDLMKFNSISWWDIAAGMLCISEAGGLMYEYEKSLKSDYTGTFVAGNKIFFNDFEDK